MRKKFAKENVWTTDQLLEVINASSVSAAIVHVRKKNSMMKAFRTVVLEAYKNLANVQRYQLFAMRTVSPGVVTCRVEPDDVGVDEDLRKMFDGITADNTKVCNLLDNYLEPLQPPAPNFEKKQQMHSKVKPYVPVEYASDPIYAAPTDEEERLANEEKQSRRKASSQKKKKSASCLEGQAMTNPVSMDVTTDSTTHPKTCKLTRKRARKET